MSPGDHTTMELEQVHCETVRRQTCETSNYLMQCETVQCETTNDSMQCETANYSMQCETADEQTTDGPRQLYFTTERLDDTALYTPKEYTENMQRAVIKLHSTIEFYTKQFPREFSNRFRFNKLMDYMRTRIIDYHLAYIGDFQVLRNQQAIIMKNLQLAQLSCEKMKEQFGTAKFRQEAESLGCIWIQQYWSNNIDLCEQIGEMKISVYALDVCIEDIHNMRIGKPYYLTTEHIKNTLSNIEI